MNESMQLEIVGLRSYSVGASRQKRKKQERGAQLREERVVLYEKRNFTHKRLGLSGFVINEAILT